MCKRKINSIVRLAFVFVIFTLCSCAHPPTPQEKMVMSTCMASCEQRSSACNATCRNNCQQCLAYSRQSAVEDYLYYQHEQYVKGGTIARELKSYRDPLQCRKTTCNCSSDYQVCMQACGGVIRKQLRVAPVCQ